MYIEAFAVYKKKEKWNDNTSQWQDPKKDKLPSGQNDERTYGEEKVIDYVQDLVFHAIDENGNQIKPPPTATNATKDFIFKIKTVDIALTKRTRKEFYKKNVTKTIRSLIEGSRNISKTDKYLRESIIISANTRNLGLL